MHYENELSLLLETFRKCRIPAALVGPQDSLEQVLDPSFQLLFGLKGSQLTEAFFGRVKGNLVYRLGGGFGLSFVMLLLPRQLHPTVLSIGPFLAVRLAEHKIMEIGERYNIPPVHSKLLLRYYNELPLLPENSPLFALLDVFCEKIWGSGQYEFTEVNERFLQEDSIASVPRRENEDVLLDMKIMEERYNAENKLMRAVSLGQYHLALPILQSVNVDSFEKRLDDPLRNLKNYGIIMNTLLRKAAEQGGVHPIHLHDISSGFAVRIEQLSSTSMGQDLMAEMFHAYCLLVRKHATKEYSSPVQKALIMIDSDLSADLSLRVLAQAQNISASYLSSLFKRETGVTLTEHVNQKRMELAAYLLRTTRLQIQTVASHCGILDVQYFSKLFKKYAGRSPKEYRERKQ